MCALSIHVSLQKICDENSINEAKCTFYAKYKATKTQSSFQGKGEFS